MGHWSMQAHTKIQTNKENVCPLVQYSLQRCAFLIVSWSGVKRIATGLPISANTFSGAMNHASPSGGLTEEAGSADARRLLPAFMHNPNSKVWWRRNNGLAVFCSVAWTNCVATDCVRCLLFQYYTYYLCTERKLWPSLELWPLLWSMQRFFHVRCGSV